MVFSVGICMLSQQPAEGLCLSSLGFLLGPKQQSC